MAEKYTETITREELPAFFRKLADAIDAVQDANFPDCTHAKKIRLGVKDEYGQVTVKLKVNKYIEDCDMCEDCDCGGKRPDGLPRYKRLKKRMRTSFKVIFKALHQHSLPPDDAVKDFISDSRLMTKYPGKGDPMYAEYDKLTDILEEAWQNKDLQKFHEAIDALNHMKSECHHKYK